MTLTLYNGWTKGKSQFLQLNLYDYGTSEPGLQTNSEQSYDIQKITRKICSKRTRLPYIPELSQYSLAVAIRQLLRQIRLTILVIKSLLTSSDFNKSVFICRDFFFFNLNFFFCVRKIGIVWSTPFNIRAITVNDFNGIDVYRNKYEFVIPLSLKNELNRESS